MPKRACGTDPRTGNEVKREVHDVADQGLRAVLLERTLQNLAQSRNRVSAGLQLPTFTHNAGRIPGNQGAVERIQKGVLQHEVPGHDGDDGRTLTQNEQSRGNRSQRSVDEDRNGKLR